MSLEMDHRVVEGIVILHLTGRLVVGFNASGFRKAMADLLQAKEINVILDLKHVEFIDSTGLGSLVIAHTSLEKAGGALKLLNLSKRHMELLVLTKLTTIFQIFDDEQEAINSFFPNREIKKFDILEFVKSQENLTPSAAEPAE